MKYIIKIPKPCHENWNEMTPTERGVFCSTCKKEVFDFTDKSDYHLAKILDSNQSVCGRFKTGQLNREIYSLQNKSTLRVGFVGWFVSLFSLSNPTFGQEKNSLKSQIEIKAKDILPIEINATTQNTIKVQGCVYNEGSVPLPGANIFFKGFEDYCKVFTDFDGNFTIEMEKYLTNKPLILVVSYVGFKSQEVIIREDINNLEVIMDMDVQELGEVIIIRKPNLWERIKSWFERNN